MAPSFPACACQAGNLPATSAQYASRGDILLRLGFWWRRRPASEMVREAVRMHCAHAWQEYAAVLYLGPQVVSYEVPGRRPDGTLRGRGLLRWTGRLLLRAAAVMAGIVLLPVLLVAELFDSGDGDTW